MCGTPCLAGGADALKGLTIVVVRAGSGNRIARIGKRAPSLTGLESQTIATAIIGQTARRNSNASLLGGAPCLIGLRADASPGGAVMIEWVWTCCR